MSMIQVKELRKDYKRAIHRRLFKTEYEVKQAVDGISFEIEEGEMVGYIGSNGAGKSTTIKILTGILTPSSGLVKINGLIPYKERKQHAKNIGVVFGQRTQLWWELPVNDSFQLLKSIYRVSDTAYNENMKLFNEILDLHQFIEKPVRQLSLGQRVRADFAAALLHDPKLIFLDEPTIGLDVLAKEKIRTFMKEVNQKKKATILLTSHDMDDIEQVCTRTMILDSGKIVYDGSISQLKEEYQMDSTIIAQLESVPIELPEIPFCQIMLQESAQLILKFPKRKTSAKQVLSQLFDCCDVKDVQIKENTVEDIVKEIYRMHHV